MTDINKIRAALAAATPVDAVAEAWLLARAERRLPSNECQAHDDVVSAVRRARERLPLLVWLAELCDRVERAETHVASAEAHIDFVTDERERFAAQREEWRAMSIAHGARAESAEAKLAGLLPVLGCQRDDYEAPDDVARRIVSERDAAITERDAESADATLGKFTRSWVATHGDWRLFDAIDKHISAHAKASWGEHG